jgi:ankyrin repeat domain-containing protein 50
MRFDDYTCDSVQDHFSYSLKQNILVQELTRIPNQTYLWAHLIFDEIRSAILLTKNRIQYVVRNIPRSPSEAYDKILSRSRDISLTRKLLHIVISATRPLTLKEMSLALSITSKHQSITDLDSVSEEQFHDDLRQLCGLFVVVVDFRIYLLHQTAREFLVSPSTQKLPHLHNNPALKWCFSFHHEESHRILAEICVQRLVFADLESIDMRAVTPQDRDKSFAEHIFLQYAAQNWTDHFREVSWHEGDCAVQKAILYCHPDSPNCVWYSIYQKFAHRSTPSNYTPLLLAFYFGLNIVIEQLPKKAFKYINVKDEAHGRSAISWAAEVGYDALVKRLLSQSMSQRVLGRNPHINTKDKQGITPLGLASKRGHDAVLQHLLQAGADINTKDDIGSTPLGLAVEHGHNTVVQKLLQAGANVDTKDRKGRSPIGWLPDVAIIWY